MLPDGETDINAEEEEHVTAYDDEKVVVLMLLDDEADFNAGRGEYANVLQMASYDGSRSIASEQRCRNKMQRRILRQCVASRII